MKHTVHYNGMVWQVRGPRAQRGDDAQTREEALKLARYLDGREKQEEEARRANEALRLGYRLEE